MQMGASGFTSRSTREVKTSIGAAADSPTTLDCQTVSKYSKLDILFVPFATRQCRASFFVHCVHGELPWLGNSNGRDSGERNPDIDNYPDIKRDDHCRSSPSPFLCTSYFVTLYLVSSFLHALIFLYCLRGNRSCGLGAVRGLSIGRGCADCPPCFTWRHTCGYRHK